MNLKCDGSLSNFAFNCNMRPSSMVCTNDKKRFKVGWCRLTPGLNSRPRDPTLAFRNFQRLKLKYDKLLSNFAFNCNLRHYIKGTVARGALSSTSEPIYPNIPLCVSHPTQTSSIFSAMSPKCDLPVFSHSAKVCPSVRHFLVSCSQAFAAFVAATHVTHPPSEVLKLS